MNELLTERLFPDRAALMSTLAGSIAEQLTAAIEAHGQASLVVTGGATPGPLYDLLAHAELAWNKISITLSDERWVDAGDAASNERLVRTRLMHGPAAAARFVGFKTPDALPSAAEALVGAAVSTLSHPFDLVLLGMGADGHVASLFPYGAATLRAMDLTKPDLVCAAIQGAAAGASHRLSLTFRALRETRRTVVLIEGEAKLAVIRRARARRDVAELPVRGVLNDPAAPVEIWWTA